MIAAIIVPYLYSELGRRSSHERGSGQDIAVRTGVRAPALLIYAVLILCAVYYLLPLYVMVVNSLKPLDEIRGGNMLNLPGTGRSSPGSALVDRADRREPDRPAALLPQLVPDGGSGRRDLHHASARSTATC